MPEEHLLMAACVMSTLPIVLLFFSAQRYFVQGIVMSGIKG
jgi:ABC-type glycerol-3-phosphate transport system permease component